MRVAALLMLCAALSKAEDFPLASAQRLDAEIQKAVDTGLVPGAVLIVETQRRGRLSARLWVALVVPRASR